MLIEGGFVGVYYQHWLSNFGGLAIILHRCRMVRIQRVWQIIFTCQKRRTVALQAHMLERKSGHYTCSGLAQIPAYSCNELA
mmetsp:Transcript_6278/g.22073  ORF Transcript_6278/g.22073 Transcript_6278/m.22073 type:complete len:82 (-) Transcript_6278:1165-1410(-)